VQKAREERQEQMQFEPVHRGRFEKSEATIIDGQNLDVPTFMRRNVPDKTRWTSPAAVDQAN